MSRIGKLPVQVPAGVEVKVDGSNVSVKGKLGELKRTFAPSMKVTVAAGEVSVARQTDSPQEKALHGLSRTLIANMVKGVSAGFSVSLDLVGTGYRVEQKGKSVTMQVGFSHPVVVDPAGSNSLRAESQTRLVVSGPDKELVGQQAAHIRKVRPPNVYTGKGIKYETEVIRRKAGKAGPSAGASQ
jgi:large subunit ribosomal protein L6